MLLCTPTIKVQTHVLASMALCLTSLPTEILEIIVDQLDPFSLCSLSRVCKPFQELARKFIFRRVYIFDDLDIYDIF